MGMMSGKTCIVTGGAGSIGLASAALLLSEGARVMLVGRNRDNLARARESLKAGDDSVSDDLLGHGHGRRVRLRRRAALHQ